MTRNELVPQDYCNMVVDYIMSKGFLPFTVEKVIKYCIKQTKILESEENINPKLLNREVKIWTRTKQLDWSLLTKLLPPWWHKKCLKLQRL